MRKNIGFAAEVAGLALVAYAGYTIAPWLGFALAGVVLVLLGIVMGAKP